MLTQANQIFRAASCPRLRVIRSSPVWNIWKLEHKVCLIYFKQYKKADDIFVLIIWDVHLHEKYLRYVYCNRIESDS